MHMDDPSVTLTVNRLPFWNRNTPPPATVGKYGPGEQVLEGWGEAVSACSSRKVNGPSVPIRLTYERPYVGLGVFSPTSGAGGEALTSEPWLIRDFIVNEPPAKCVRATPLSPEAASPEQGRPSLRPS